MRRTRISDLFSQGTTTGQVLVKGWVRTRRDSKQVSFVALNDGSSINNLQIVVDIDKFDGEMLKRITTGA